MTANFTPLNVSAIPTTFIDQNTTNEFIQNVTSLSILKTAPINFLNIALGNLWPVVVWGVFLIILGIKVKGEIQTLAIAGLFTALFLIPFSPGFSKILMGIFALFSIIIFGFTAFYKNKTY